MVGSDVNQHRHRQQSATCGEEYVAVSDVCLGDPQKGIWVPGRGRALQLPPEGLYLGLPAASSFILY